MLYGSMGAYVVPLNPIAKAMLRAFCRTHCPWGRLLSFVISILPIENPEMDVVAGYTSSGKRFAYKHITFFDLFFLRCFYIKLATALLEFCRQS